MQIVIIAMQSHVGSASFCIDADRDADEICIRPGKSASEFCRWFVRGLACSAESARTLLMAAALTAAAAEGFAKLTTTCASRTRASTSTRSTSRATRSVRGHGASWVRESYSVCYCAVRVLAACHAVQLG